MSTKPHRAAIYVRLSVHRGDKDPSVSPEAQEERCRAYADADRPGGFDDSAVRPAALDRWGPTVIRNGYEIHKPSTRERE